MTYDGVTYYYITNPMGDVTGIANESGTQLVFYYYTAYGTAYASYNTAYQALGATLSGVNPLFYRGYVYDRETGLYYLQSRYYNPEVGRFINADALVSTGQGLLGNNMFAYCNNSPLNFTDRCGNEAITITVGTAVMIVIGLAALFELGARFLQYIFEVISNELQYTYSQISVHYAKKSKKSGKEKANDTPSYVSRNDVDPTKSAQENARNIMNRQFGPGNWKPGAGTDYNKIVKWIVRSLMSFFSLLDEDEEN